MPKNKSKSPLAYEKYLQTGTVTGYYTGAIRRGPGVPPENPMSPEMYDKVAASLRPPLPPDAPPENTLEFADWQVEQELAYNARAKGWDGVKRWVGER